MGFGVGAELVSGFVSALQEATYVFIEIEFQLEFFNDGLVILFVYF